MWNVFIWFTAWHNIPFIKPTGNAADLYAVFTVIHLIFSCEKTPWPTTKITSALMVVELIFFCDHSIVNGVRVITVLGSKA